MAASTVIPLTKKSQEAFLAFYASSQDNRNSTREEMRARMEKVDRAYQREVDRSEEHLRAEAANLRGDPNRFRNMTVPVVMGNLIPYSYICSLTGSSIMKASITMYLSRLATRG